MSDLPFSRPFDVGRIGGGRFDEPVQSTAAERAAIVKAFGLEGLDRLEATVSIEPWRRVGLKLEGRLFADVVQACVISAEPVPARIDHSFTLTFLPPEAMADNPKSVAEAEVIVVFDQDDPPERLDDRTIDLGSIVTEQLALALDPYPRAPGAAWPEAGQTFGDAETSPFAALEKLRDK
jgi:uncharacterized metal-binding protein YceD (DUF177 family)